MATDQSTPRDDAAPSRRQGWLDRRLDRRSRRRYLDRQDRKADLQAKLDLRGDKAQIWAGRKIKLKSAGVSALVTVPIIAPMSVAWTGQAGFAMRVLQWSFPAGVVYAASYELTIAFCAWMHHQARSDGDSGLEYRVWTWLFALGSALQQWWHYADHWHPTPRSVTYASMTLIGLAIWERHAKLIHRRVLRAKGMLTGPLPKIGLRRWVRFPVQSWTAWSLLIQTDSQDLDLIWSTAGELVKSRRADRRRTSPPKQVAAADQRPRVRLEKARPADQVRQTKPALTAGLDQVRTRTAVTARVQPEGPAQVRTPADQDGPSPVLPAASRTRTTPAAPTAVRTPVPAQDEAARPEQPSPAGDEDFVPTATERRAIEHLLNTGAKITRATVADLMRNHPNFKEPINTTRAGRVARWGRDQAPGLKSA